MTPSNCLTCAGGCEGSTEGDVGLEEQRLAKKKSRKDIEAEGTGSVKAFKCKEYNAFVGRCMPGVWHFYGEPGHEGF